MKLGCKTGADLRTNQTWDISHILHWQKKLFKKLTHNSVAQEHVASYRLLVAETGVRPACYNREFVRIHICF